jgi:hypothetical protein
MPIRNCAEKRRPENSWVCTPRSENGTRAAPVINGASGANHRVVTIDFGYGATAAPASEIALSTAFDTDSPVGPDRTRRGPSFGSSTKAATGLFAASLGRDCITACSSPAVPIAAVRTPCPPGPLAVLLTTTIWFGCPIMRAALSANTMTLRVSAVRPSAGATIRKLAKPDWSTPEAPMSFICSGASLAAKCSAVPAL